MAYIQKTSPFKQTKTPKKSKAEKTATNVAEAGIINTVLSKNPVAETLYDIGNVGRALWEGDPVKASANFAGALVPGLSGKVVEASIQEYLPSMPQGAKDKFKAVMAGKRATPEEMRKAQQSWKNKKKK
jgi:hypothetical protein